MLKLFEFLWKYKDIIFGILFLVFSLSMIKPIMDLTDNAKDGFKLLLTKQGFFIFLCVLSFFGFIFFMFKSIFKF